MIVKTSFDNFDINRIYAEPFSRNFGSRRCLEKAGFRLEAQLKNNVIKNGVLEDSCIYAILKDDYISNRRLDKWEEKINK